MMRPPSIFAKLLLATFYFTFYFSCTAAPARAEPKLALVDGASYFSPNTLPSNSNLAPSTAAKQWAALGDSYSAGLGAGTRLTGHDQDTECARFNGSYPSILNSYPQIQASDENFHFLSCSGETTSEILQNQVPKLNDSSLDFITLSGGGNDVSLTQLLNDCIFQWNPFTGSSCEASIQVTNTTIFEELPNKLDLLLAAVKPKLIPGGTVYYTSYATFFDDLTPDCTNVSWAFWYNLGNREFLTNERRQLLNYLVEGVNTQIRLAVERAGPGVVHIGYDPSYVERSGRFCEDGVIEPEPNRKGLLFYEWGTTDDGMGNDTSPTTFTEGDVGEGTFAGEINSWVAETIRKHPEAIHTSGILNVAAAFEENAEGLGYVGSVIPDAWKRVFHPEIAGHQVIADLVLGAIEQSEWEKMEQRFDEL